MIVVRLLALIVLMAYAFPVSAQTQEWMDKGYNFAQKRRIFFDSSIPTTINEIEYHEIDELWEKQIVHLAEVLKKAGHIVVARNGVADQIKRERNIDLRELERTNPDEAERLVVDTVIKNFDVVLNVEVLYYDTGSEYSEGHYNFTTNSANGTVTPYYVSGGNVPVAYACARFTVTDLKSGKNVWIRIDDRGRANKTIMDHTKPEDLLNRIFKRYASDATKVFTGKKDE